MMNPTDTPETEADQFEALTHELHLLDSKFQAERQAAVDRYVATYLDRMEEAERIEKDRRESGYYDESDRHAFESAHCGY